MSDLKPCPFCGSEPLMVHSALNEYHSVAPKIGCSHCRYIIQAPDLAIDMDKSVKENCDFEDWQTISYWNTRPAEDALNKELTEQAANYENIICEYKRDVKQAVKQIDTLTAEVERLKAVLLNIKNRLFERTYLNFGEAAVADWIVQKVNEALDKAPDNGKMEG